MSQASAPMTGFTAISRVARSPLYVSSIFASRATSVSRPVWVRDGTESTARRSQFETTRLGGSLSLSASPVRQWSAGAVDALRVDRCMLRAMSTQTAPPARLRRWPLLALLTSVVVLTGCIRVEFGIRLNDDGSGDISILSALNTEAMSALGGDLGAETGNPLGDLDGADLPPGAAVEEYDEDGFVGVRATFPFAAGDDVKDTIDALLSDAGDGLSGEPAGLDGPFERFDLRRDGSGWRFDAVVPPLNPEAPSGGGGSALGGEFAELLLEDASFTIRLELPGDVVEHNADDVDGGALVWSLDFFSDQPRNLTALTGGGGSGGATTTVIAVVVVALLAAAAIVWFRSRTRSPADA